MRQWQFEVDVWIDQVCIFVHIAPRQEPDSDCQYLAPRRVRVTFAKCAPISNTPKTADTVTMGASAEGARGGATDQIGHHDERSWFNELSLSGGTKSRDALGERDLACA